MSERAVFDVRVHVTGRDRENVYALIADLLERARAVAPEGVIACYSQLREPRSRQFDGTMRPRRTRR